MDSILDDFARTLTEEACEAMHDAFAEAHTFVVALECIGDRRLWEQPDPAAAIRRVRGYFKR